MKIVKLQHDRVNLTYSTDWHISAIPPGRRADDYLTNILAKLGFISNLTHKLKGASLCGGDVFHIKNSRSPANSIPTVARVFRSLREFPMGRVWGTVGNHDLAAGDRNESLSSQPLHLLIAAGVYCNLNDEPVLFVNQEETIRVLVETFPYAHGEEALAQLLATGERPAGVTHRIGLVHAYGEAGVGGGMFGEAIGYNQIDHLDYDFLLWGHDHSRHETETVGNITHVNLGSLARAAYSFDEVDRPVVATVLSFASDGVRYKEVQVPTTPLKIAFVTADKPVADVASSDELREFFAAMDEQVSDVVESTDPVEILTSLCPESETKTLDLVKELCEFG